MHILACAIKTPHPVDRLGNGQGARRNSTPALSGRTIPDRGYYDLRLMDSGAKIGELDEEFVWERRLGDTFMLGSQVWRIMRITPNNVEVLPGERTINIVPFWRAEARERDFFYAEKIGLFLEEVEQRLKPETLAEELTSRYSWSAAAAAQLACYLQRQKTVTGKPLPHRHHILIEHLADPLNASEDRY